MSNEVVVGLLGVLTAFLGVIASFIALAWVEWIKPRLYAPELKIEFENKFPYCKISPTNFFGDDRPALLGTPAYSQHWQVDCIELQR